MIQTNDNFWDCECGETDYIKNKNIEICEACGADQDDRPDSRQDEIENILCPKCEFVYEAIPQIFVRCDCSKCPVKNPVKKENRGY